MTINVTRREIRRAIARGDVKLTVCDQQWVDTNSIRNLDDLNACLAVYTQHVGSQMLGCEELGGVEYIEVATHAPCRKDDAEAIDVTSEQLLRLLFLKIESGKYRFSSDMTIAEINSMHLYWRVKPELEVIPFNRVAEFRDDGPDIDPLTDKRCVLDRRWVWVKTYALFAWGIPKQISKQADLV